MEWWMVVTVPLCLMMGFIIGWLLAQSKIEENSRTKEFEEHWEKSRKEMHSTYSKILGKELADIALPKNRSYKR